MTPSTPPSPLEQASVARIQAIVNYGFTERQARFLALVMRHAGVCVPRQYAQVAGIAQGAKCNAFFDRLVRRGHARAIECVHNRARLYLVHSRLLYHAIGEPSSRYRRTVSPRLALERLMLLDALLSRPADHWLATPAEKASALPLTGETRGADSFPIGVQADGQVVVLYLAAEPWPDAFRTFLRAHVPLLQNLPRWTIRIVLPRRFGHAHDAYQRAIHEELESSLSPVLIADLKRYFECRRAIHTTGTPQADDVFREGHQRFGTPRFDDLYRRWITHGDEVFTGPSSAAITEALESGAGRVESFVLPHSYRHLSPLVSHSRSTVDEVEKGVEKGAHRGAIGRGRPQPRASTPWPSRERSVVM
jgi:hypothetical protein